MNNRIMPNFFGWSNSYLGTSRTDPSRSQTDIKIPAPFINQAFVDSIQGQFARMTYDNNERLFHSHGHALEEVWRLRHSEIERVVDLVIYPGAHNHVVEIVKAANIHNVVIIPFGGGTNVTLAVFCSPEEKRMIISMDMREMNKIKWVDKVNGMACIEAGMCGQDIEEQLKRDHGVCTGMEPDSVEFSTLGGWIATRASGMKKNRYGNIEDILITCKLVTGKGVLEKTCQAPRYSGGPDINELVLGSEGTFGVITEAVVKVKPVPECQKYGAIILPSFEIGFKFMQELASLRCFPASIRMVDNNQFRLAGSLKAEATYFETLLDKCKKFYVTKWKGFDETTLAVATLVYEGFRHEVEVQERIVNTIANKYHALFVNPEESRRAYSMTFMIAYVRDFAMDYYVLCESIEMSIPYGGVMKCCVAVEQRLAELAKQRGVTHTFFTKRVTQLYETGCCVYMYYAINYKGLEDPVGTFDFLESSAREVILDHGGSISHHHGVGKLRSRFMPRTLGGNGVNLLKAVKSELDPLNVFATHNMGL